MKPFETVGPDGRTYLHYDNWERWRNERLSEYHCPQGQYRFDIELITPRDRLEDVPVERNPHGFSHTPTVDSHYCYYNCSDWSTIYGVHDAHKHDVDGPSLRMLIESGCPEPLWGERIRLLSNFTYIAEEPWGMNVPNKFAYFRGQYWRVIMWQFLHPFQWGVGYPLRTRFLSSIRNWRSVTFNTIGFFFTGPPIEHHEINWRKEGF